MSSSSAAAKMSVRNSTPYALCPAAHDRTLASWPPAVHAERPDNDVDWWCVMKDVLCAGALIGTLRML